MKVITVQGQRQKTEMKIKHLLHLLQSEIKHNIKNAIESNYNTGILIGKNHGQIKKNSYESKYDF